MAPMDKLRALETFVAIVDRGSLTAAADALDSSLPAVVRQLAALESQLGVRLLHRTTRRLSLTEDGRLNLAGSRRIRASVVEADRSLLARSAAYEAEPSGTVSVTAPVLFGHMHVAPAVARFLQRYPKMRVNLVLLDRVVDLVQEGHDLAVRIARMARSSFRYCTRSAWQRRQVSTWRRAPRSSSVGLPSSTPARRSATSSHCTAALLLCRSSPV